MAGRARKIISLVLSFGLILQQASFAQIATELNIAGYLSRMGSNLTQERFRPAHLSYFSYDALSDNFKLLLDKGDLRKLEDTKAKEETKTLLSYFLVGLTLPDSMFWVNLRPDSEDQIIDQYLEKTDVGRIMLEADLQLKKDTSLFTSPQTPEGREYWDKLYKKAAELYGNDNITIPTLTRPWIVPGEIIVRESQESAYVYKAGLKVMLEQDYLKDSATYNFKDSRSKALNEYSSQLIRELIIPKLTKEVNSSKRYAPLRQVYYSLILARWFKLRFTGKPGTYSSLINSKDLTNLISKESWSKTEYFKQYQKSFAQGEYNIKEPVYTPSGQVIRSYFSGGVAFASSAIKADNGVIGKELSIGMLSRLGDVMEGRGVELNKIISNSSPLISGLGTKEESIMGTKGVAYIDWEHKNGGLKGYRLIRADYEVVMIAPEDRFGPAVTARRQFKSVDDFYNMLELLTRYADKTQYYSGDVFKKEFREFVDTFGSAASPIQFYSKQQAEEWVKSHLKIFYISSRFNNINEADFTAFVTNIIQDIPSGVKLFKLTMSPNYEFIPKPTGGGYEEEIYSWEAKADNYSTSDKSAHIAAIKALANMVAQHLYAKDANMIDWEGKREAPYIAENQERFRSLLATWFGEKYLPGQKKLTSKQRYFFDQYFDHVAAASPVIAASPVVKKDQIQQPFESSLWDEDGNSQKKEHPLVLRKGEAFEDLISRTLKDPQTYQLQITFAKEDIRRSSIWAFHKSHDKHLFSLIDLQGVDQESIRNVLQGYKEFIISEEAAGLGPTLRATRKSVSSPIIGNGEPLIPIAIIRLGLSAVDSLKLHIYQKLGIIEIIAKNPLATVISFEVKDPNGSQSGVFTEAKMAFERADKILPLVFAYEDGSQVNDYQLRVRIELTLNNRVKLSVYDFLVQEGIILPNEIMEKLKPGVVDLAEHTQAPLVSLQALKDSLIRKIDQACGEFQLNYLKIGFDYSGFVKLNTLKELRRFLNYQIVIMKRRIGDLDGKIKKADDPDKRDGALEGKRPEDLESSNTGKALKVIEEFLDEIPENISSSAVQQQPKELFEKINQAAQGTFEAFNDLSEVPGTIIRHSDVDSFFARMRSEAPFSFTGENPVNNEFALLNFESLLKRIKYFYEFFRNSRFRSKLSELKIKEGAEEVLVLKINLFEGKLAKLAAIITDLEARAPESIKKIIENSGIKDVVSASSALDEAKAVLQKNIPGWRNALARKYPVLPVTQGYFPGFNNLTPKNIAEKASRDRERDVHDICVLAKEASNGLTYAQKRELATWLAGELNHITAEEILKGIILKSSSAVGNQRTEVGRQKTEGSDKGLASSAIIQSILLVPDEIVDSLKDIFSNIRSTENLVNYIAVSKQKLTQLLKQYGLEGVNPDELFSSETMHQTPVDSNYPIKKIRELIDEVLANEEVTIETIIRDINLEYTNLYDYNFYLNEPVKTAIKGYLNNTMSLPDTITVFSKIPTPRIGIDRNSVMITLIVAKQALKYGLRLPARRAIEFSNTAYVSSYLERNIDIITWSNPEITRDRVVEILKETGEMVAAGLVMEKRKKLEGEIYFTEQYLILLNKELTSSIKPGDYLVGEKPAERKQAIQRKIEKVNASIERSKQQLQQLKEEKPAEQPGKASSAVETLERDLVKGSTVGKLLTFAYAKGILEKAATRFRTVNNPLYTKLVDFELNGWGKGALLRIRLDDLDGKIHIKISNSGESKPSIFFTVSSQNTVDLNGIKKDIIYQAGEGDIKKGAAIMAKAIMDALEAADRTLDGQGQGQLGQHLTGQDSVASSAVTIEESMNSVEQATLNTLRQISKIHSEFNYKAGVFEYSGLSYLFEELGLSQNEFYPVYQARALVTDYTPESNTTLQKKVGLVDDYLSWVARQLKDAEGANGKTYRAINYLIISWKDNIKKASSTITSDMQMPKNPGGIDFRVTPMAIQPMGSFQGLSFILPKLSQQELARIDIPQEVQQVKNMVASGTSPSGSRIKELIAACKYKNQEGYINELFICLLEGFKVEQENALESSPDSREALVVADALVSGQA